MFRERGETGQETLKKGIGMHVTSIIFENRRLDPDTRDDCADVAFVSGGVVARFMAKAPRAAPRLELVRDAVRQLKRMPEFRSGQVELSFEGMCIRSG